MGVYANSEYFDTIRCGGIELRFINQPKAMSELDDIDELVRIYRAKILRFVTFSTGDPDLAETITQDTLLRAYTGRKNFRGDCSTKTWLIGIAINVTRDHMRSARFKFWQKTKESGIDIQEMASHLPAKGPSVEEHMLAKEKAKQLARAVAVLSDRQRTIFLMKFSEEMSVAEISEVLTMPVNTVRTHLHRALNAVRKQLGSALP